MFHSKLCFKGPAGRLNLLESPRLSRGWRGWGGRERNIGESRTALSNPLGSWLDMVGCAVTAVQRRIGQEISIKRKKKKESQQVAGGTAGRRG